MNFHIPYHSASSMINSQPILSHLYSIYPQLFEANPPNRTMTPFKALIIFLTRTQNRLYSLQMEYFLSLALMEKRRTVCCLTEHSFSFFVRKWRAKQLTLFLRRISWEFRFFQATSSTWKMKHISFVLLTPIQYVSFFQAGVMTVHLLYMRCLLLS